jgi:hypothetical protein
MKNLSGWVYLNTLKKIPIRLSGNSGIADTNL